jgi:mRNA interferase RelE/StbE
MVAGCYYLTMYKITFSKNADKALRRMPRNQSVIIANKIKQLAINPLEMRNVKKLTNHPGFRLRVGDWRIVYTVNDKELLIHVINVKPRGEVYK